jgi:hypothetical protein
MTASTWPGQRLVSARATQRAVRRQCLALASAGAAVALWLLASAPRPGRLLEAVLIGLAAAIALELVLAAIVRDRGDCSADDLIERGFTACGRTDPVSRALEDRIHGLTSERARRRLAAALRRQLELESGPLVRSTARLGPLTPSLGLAEHADLVEWIARAIECGPLDPRAAVRIRRLLTAPLPPSGVDAAAAGAALRDVAGLLDGVRAGPEDVSPMHHPTDPPIPTEAPHGHRR